MSMGVSGFKEGLRKQRPRLLTLRCLAAMMAGFVGLGLGCACQFLGSAGECQMGPKQCHTRRLVSLWFGTPASPITVLGALAAVLDSGSTITGNDPYHGGDSDTV